MKIFELLETSDDPFIEPKFTPEEELKYLRRRLTMLHDKINKITDAAYKFYTVEVGVVRMTSIRSRTSAENVFEIPKLKGKADVYALYSSYGHKENARKYKQLSTYAEQARMIKQKYKLLLGRADRLAAKIDKRK